MHVVIPAQDNSVSSDVGVLVGTGVGREVGTGVRVGAGTQASLRIFRSSANFLATRASMVGKKLGVGAAAGGEAKSQADRSRNTRATAADGDRFIQTLC